MVASSSSGGARSPAGEAARRVRLYVFTQEDRVHLPRLLDPLLGARRDVVGIGVAPGELRAAHAGRYWTRMGRRAFALQVATL